MSGRSSPMNGDYEGTSEEPAIRLTVRKDLFPNALHKVVSPSLTAPEGLVVSGVKLETDFEQSIDDIVNQRFQLANGAMSSDREKHRHRKHKRHSSKRNGRLTSDTNKRRSSPRESHPHRTLLKVRGGKNLNLVSSSECQNVEEEESSDDEVLGHALKLPVKVLRQSGKPYSHELSQLSSKKSKSRDHGKEWRTNAVVPCSGKPRSMLDICTHKVKKKSKKHESKATYRSEILDDSLKIKIQRTDIVHTKEPAAPIVVIPVAPPKKSKKKKASSPAPSESSGEEYDPSRGDTAASMSVAAPKPRHPPLKTRKPNTSKHKGKADKTEAAKASRLNHRDESVPQSPWGNAMPDEILVKIFGLVVSSQGTLPSVIRLGKVCKLWQRVSCSPELWRNLDLAQHTYEKHKIDQRLLWLLENRLSMCHTLNVGHWKVSNIPWVVSAIVECAPELVELGLAGWTGLTADQLYDLILGLPQLRRLDLSHTSEMGGSGACLSASNMARIVENFGERITHLTMGNNMFSALQQILTSIAAHCPNLEVLDISGARATSHPAVVPLEALQKGCPKMRVFRAANAQLVLSNLTHSQETESNGWPCLEELSIAAEASSERVGVGEYRLGDEALARLVRGATRLRLLDLRGLQRLTHSGLVRVPAWELQHLFLGCSNVSRQNNSGLELICEKWSDSLIELDLSWANSSRALDPAIQALADTFHSKLRILNLCGSSVSLEPVKKVLLRCTQLESLNLSSCRALPRGMKRLYTGKELQQLKDSFNPDKAKEETEKKKKDAKTKVDVKPDVTSLQAQSNVDLTLSVKKVTANKSCETANSSSQTSYSPNSQLEDIKRGTHASSSQLLSPSVHLKPDSSSTPGSDTIKAEISSPHFSPISKPDSQIQTSPEVHEVSKGCNSWNLGQFKSTPTHKSEASPLNKLDTYAKIKQCKIIEQCSPTTSQEIKLSPEMVTVKQEIKSINWNYGSYSPMTRQDGQFSQRSPYSAQPSPAQPSPYSAQPSPYSTQPSPYSSQPSPYSAQPSPDTSQMTKTDLQKSNQWNTGSYSPMTKHPAPFSPHPAAHASPDPGLAMKAERTGSQYSPMSRQDRLLTGPYSPRPSQRAPPAPGAWCEPGLVWNENRAQTWPCLPSFDTGTTRSDATVSDQWTMGRFRVEPPLQVHNNFVEQNVNFDTLTGNIGQSHIPQNFLD